MLGVIYENTGSRRPDLMILNREATKSIRSAFGKTLEKLGHINSNIVVLDADLACSTQTQFFAKSFPDRFFDCGISEQDMIATSAGLASAGKIPFAASFAMFATGRTYDQIRNSVCYPEFNVKIIGTHGGVTVGEDGASHQALEDVALMRGLPNMTVIVPADCRECEEVIKFAASTYGPMYIRISRTNVCDVFDENYKFEPYKAVIIEDGTDASVITNGETLAEVIQACQNLKKEGYSIRIVHAPFVKPFDSETVIDSAKKTGLVITVENHSVIGGLGSAVCEVLSEYYPSKVKRIGIYDKFGQSGKAEFLLDYYGLSASKLTNSIKDEIEKYKKD